MVVSHKVSLKKYSKMKMGGIANNFYEPNSTSELIELVNSKKTDKIYFISKGSNILINDKKKFENVCILSNFDNSLIDIGEGNFIVGGSVTLQKLIKTINDSGYGGIENLINVPGLVGASVAMNAGTGPKQSIFIGDFVTKVYALVNGVEKQFSKKDSQFQYRSSIFKSNKYIITKVEFDFYEKSEAEIKKDIDHKLSIVRNSQEIIGNNLGSIFSSADHRILRLSRLVFNSMFWRKVSFSSKSPNIIVNNGGKYKQIRQMIRFVIWLHKVLNKKCKLEVTVWE